MNEHGTPSEHWTIAPRTVQRLWPLIDVYGRIERAQRAEVTADGRLAHSA